MSVVKLTTDAELAGAMTLTLEQFHALRKRHNWPCVRLGRFEYRFTDAQVEEIVALHTQAAKPKKSTAPKKAPAAVPGQTARSKARSRSG